MADTTVRGRFVWRELMTSDASRAHAFYTKVLGWKTQAWDQDPSYTMFAAASGPLAGTWESEAGSPHWLPYIGTPDIAATLEQARNLGARVSKDVTEMSNGGKYAVLDDPQGAAFGIYQSGSAEPEPHSPPKRGEYSWHELMTSDFRAAFDFYSALFGWQPIGEHDMGEIGIYFTFGLDGNELGGMFNRSADMPGGPAWLGYVRVKDVKQTVDKVTASGGTLLQGPMEVPGGDWIAQFADPQGALFAVHTLAADLKTSKAAAAPAEKTAAAAEKEDGSQPRAKRNARTAKKSATATKTSRKKAARKQAARKTAAKSATKKASKTAKKSTKKSKKKVARKAPAKAQRKKTAAKRGAASRSAKRPARKTAKTSKKKAAKKTTKARSASKKRSVKRPRKAK